MECQNSSGAKHRSCSGTKLNAGSRLHYPYRSRRFHPGSKLLRRLLRVIPRIFIWAFTDAQRGRDLLGLWRLQKVLKVAVLREHIVERFVHDIIGGCVDESGILIDLLSGRFVQANRSADIPAQVDFSSGISSPSIGVESSDLSSGNHPLRRQRDLPRTSGADCDGNLEAAADHQHRDHVIYRNAFDEPKSGRCDIHGPLRVVEWIRLIGAAQSQLPRELCGVLPTGEFMENPRPAAFGIAVLVGMLSWGD